MKHCHICQSESLFLLRKDGYDFWKCSACGLVFVYPQPEAGHLAREVYSEESGYQKHKGKDLSTVKENIHYKKVLDFLTKNQISGKLLDVGCSSGEFLYFAKRRGFEVYGVELNPLTAKIAIAHGLSVKVGTLQGANHPKHFFDIVFLGDVIEHVPNPLSLLLECKQLLKPGGTLIVSTPNLDCFWARATFKLYTWFSIPWSVLTPPHHLFQFREDNLKMLLHDIGFSPLATWFRRPPTLLYELGSLHLWGKFKREKTIKNLLSLFFAFSVYTKLYFLTILISPFKKKDFGMIVCSRKIKS